MKIKDLHASTTYDITLTKTHGEEQMLCPACSHSRKKNKDKCMSWNIDKGVGYCNHCTTSFVMHKTMREKPVKEYRIPEWKNITSLTDKATKWFEGRGISQSTLRKMGVYSDRRFMRIRMPDGDVREVRDAEVMAFPFFMPGEEKPRNIKYRGANKSFALESGAELIFYNYKAIPENKEVVITEGECFTGEAEILTKKGFVRFDEYNGEEVAQVGDQLDVSYTKPMAYIVKDFDGDLVQIIAGSYYSLTTRDHNLVVFRRSTGELIKKKALEFYQLKRVPISFPPVCYLDTDGIALSDDAIKLMSAIYLNGGMVGIWEMMVDFTRLDKANEFKRLCDSLGVECKIVKQMNGSIRAKFQKHGLPHPYFGRFPQDWIGNISEKQCDVLLKSLAYWSNDSADFSNGASFVVNNEDDAKFLQTIGFTAGFSVNYGVSENGFRVKYSRPISRATNKTRTMLVPHKGLVYCVQVPTGRIIVRQNGKIVIIGNCDALSYIEAGIENVVSVPNGAGAKDLSYLDYYIDDLEHINKFYIAVDFDEAGLKLREELVRRLGAERCSIVTFQGYKDANELLINRGSIAVRNSILEAKEIPIQGAVDVDSLYDELQAMFSTGLPRGVELGFKPMDDLVRWETGRLSIVSGIPSSGKSNFVDFMSIRLNVAHGWKTAYWSPENHPTKLHIANLAEKIIGKRFKEGSMNQMEFDAVFDYIRDNYFFINPEEHTRLSDILEMAKQLVKRRGIKHLVIDPLNCLTPETDSESRTLQIEDLLNKLTTFARKYDLLITLVAHPRKIPDEGGRMKIPTMYDISGSSTFYDKADYGIIVYRWFERKQTQVFVQKVKWRNLGRINENEQDGLMAFNPANGRYDVPIDYRYMDNHSYLDDLGQEEFEFEYEDLPIDDFPTGANEFE